MISLSQETLLSYVRQDGSLCACITISPPPPMAAVCITDCFALILLIFDTIIRTPYRFAYISTRSITNNLHRGDFYTEYFYTTHCSIITDRAIARRLYISGHSRNRTKQWRIQGSKSTCKKANLMCTIIILMDEIRIEY